jgi:hypothetical protein
MARGILLFLVFVVTVAAFVDVTLASSWLFGSDKGRLYRLRDKVINIANWGTV